MLRTRDTEQQISLSKVKRERNVQGKFKVPAEKKSLVLERKIGLIDDVMTLGATGDVCARVLL